MIRLDANVVINEFIRNFEIKIPFISPIPKPRTIPATYAIGVFTWFAMTEAVTPVIA
jgi:hypothetical protein